MSACACIVGLVVASGCASTLPASEWVTELPRGACVVAIEHTDGTGSWTLEHHHDAEGRVLSGSARLRYHGRAWERFAYDARGRLAEIAALRHSSCTRERECHVTYEMRYSYDDEGRLVREHRTHADSSPRESEVAWEYEGERVVRRTTTTRYAASAETRVREYAYDALGRVVAMIDDGQLRERRRYEGACGSVPAPPSAPSALAAASALPCLRSPAYVLDECSRP